MTGWHGMRTLILLAGLAGGASAWAATPPSTELAERFAEVTRRYFEEASPPGLTVQIDRH